MKPTIELTAPNLTKNDIAKTASRLLGEYQKAVPPAIRDLDAIEFHHFYQYVIKPKYLVRITEDLALQPAANGRAKLGTFNIGTNTAIIGLPRQDPRRTWTLWHEVVGHGVLHGPYFRQMIKHTLTTTFIDVTDISIDSAAESVLEKQANYLASLVAAPRPMVSRWIIRIFRLYERKEPIRYVGPGPYSLTVNQETLYPKISSYHDLCRYVATKIKPFFGGLSTEALAFRVADTACVLNASVNPYIGHYGNDENTDITLNRLAV